MICTYQSPPLVSPLLILLLIFIVQGDKQETAVSIGYLSGVLDPSMTVLVLDDTDEATLRRKLDKIISRYNVSYGGKPTLLAELRSFVWGQPPSPMAAPIPFVASNGPSISSSPRLVLPNKPRVAEYSRPNLKPTEAGAPTTQTAAQQPKTAPLAIIIDGACLNVALGPVLNYKFFAIAQACASVICCRCTPLQKSAVVELVQEQSSMYGDPAVTLSIGDGANDVPMIQKAHIGVGINDGLEGRAAMLASDFSVPRFAHLSQLLLVHGHRSYKRLSKLVLYSFTKNLALALPQFYFSFMCIFSGQMTYFDFLFTMYVTCLPPGVPSFAGC